MAASRRHLLAATQERCHPHLSGSSLAPRPCAVWFAPVYREDWSAARLHARTKSKPPEVPRRRPPMRSKGQVAFATRRCAVNRCAAARRRASTLAGHHVSGDPRPPRGSGGLAVGCERTGRSSGGGVGDGNGPRGRRSSHDHCRSGRIPQPQVARTRDSTYPRWPGGRTALRRRTRAPSPAGCNDSRAIGLKVRVLRPQYGRSIPIPDARLATVCRSPPRATSEPRAAADRRPRPSPAPQRVRRRARRAPTHAGLSDLARRRRRGATGRAPWCDCSAPRRGYAGLNAHSCRRRAAGCSLKDPADRAQ